ncbi:aldo/keto reductase [Microbacterium resistens]|uniref:Aldo/keto reductase n=1 Tax=Microbacterium resistens TaxID=156977 RepID=A0ABY3RNU5_9MICO|nr:aldo/keto reductase [Microbacterium resistens]UGS25629.1 aldo/keto reductase [Microbacterium resistens]
MKHTTLPQAGFDVPALSLGSYETYSRLEYREIVDIVSLALEAGITLFDVAHYTRAPHTEVILSRALEDAGAPDTTRVMTKVWKGDDPDADVVTELKETLFRLRRDDVDIVLLYGPRWGVDEPIAHAQDARRLVDEGLSKSWGGINWSPEHIGSVVDACRADGAPLPVLMQLKYNIARRSVGESPAYQRVFAESGMRMQASDSLEGGVLAGKDPAGAGTSGRVLGRDPGRIRDQIVAAMPAIRRIADGFGVSTAELALAYALAYEYTATVLFGASSVAQLKTNLGAVDLAERHGTEIRARLDEAVRIDGHTLDVPPGSIVQPHEDPYRER